MNFRTSIEINVVRTDRLARNLQAVRNFMQIYAPSRINVAYGRAIERALAMAQDVRDVAKQGSDLRTMQKTASLLGDLIYVTITIFNCARLRGLNINL